MRLWCFGPIDHLKKTPQSLPLRRLFCGIAFKHPPPRLSFYQTTSVAAISGDNDLSIVDLFLLDGFKQGFEIAFAKTVVTFALNEFKEDRTNHGF